MVTVKPDQASIARQVRPARSSSGKREPAIAAAGQKRPIRLKCVQPAEQTIEIDPRAKPSFRASRSDEKRKEFVHRTGAQAQHRRRVRTRMRRRR